MSASSEVIVVGGGIGGLCAAILIAAQNIPVRLLEGSRSLGGKAGTDFHEGVEFDTGPSVLTLPEVFDDVFSAARLSRADAITLTSPRPGFRYLYADGVSLDVFHGLEETLHSVEQTLGKSEALQLESYLDYARQIWEAAAPHFVMKEAPDMTRLLFGGLGAWGAITKIDPLNTLLGAIKKRVDSPHLRQLLMRYATYNGSDVRTAPATLGCISHVELALGGYGVQGGMSKLVLALKDAAYRVGVEIELNARVEEIQMRRKRVCGVKLQGGREIAAAHVVANADVAHLVDHLLAAPGKLKEATTRSMSAYCSVYQAERRPPERKRVAHTVVFPDNYESEFRDIFDEQRIPRDPTIYLCAQEACHGRSGWTHHEPVFAMVNTPPCDDGFSGQVPDSLAPLIKRRLVQSGLLTDADAQIWQRTPRDLAERFPGSRGSLYGAASNSAAAAFNRPPNELKDLPGLYLASGSAHPGGGVPMVAQSGKQAARAVIRNYS